MSRTDISLQADGLTEASRALCEDRWDDVVDYLFALPELPAFEELLEDLGERADRDGSRGRTGLPFRERDPSSENAAKGARQARDAGTRRRRLESVLPANLRFLGQHVVRRGTKDAVDKLFSRVQVFDPVPFREPTDRARFLAIAAARLAGRSLPDRDRRYLADWLPRMNPHRVGLAYKPGEDVPLRIGDLAYESATSAAAGSSALTLAASSYPAVGLVADISGGEVIIVPPDQFALFVKPR